jgi:hypothetical protein
MRVEIMKKNMLILLMTILPAAWTPAQENSIDRKYVPIIQKTAVAPLNNLIISEWSAFRFDQKKSEWSAIPFQFDELRDDGRYDHLADGITDANDELAVMPTDLGDRAESSQWLDDAATRNSPRIELEFADPLSPGKNGWIYLYRNVTAKPMIEPFLDYSPGPAGMPAADTVKTRAFSLGHNQNGWMDFLTIGADKRDLIDRFKLRLAGSGGIAGTYEINEDYIKGRTDNEAVYFFPGPVRAFHIINANFLLSKLKLAGVTDKGFRSDFQYFPHSFQIYAETDLNQVLLLLFGTKLLRQSLDFNENAHGMTIYSPFNPNGLSIDGVADQPVEDITGGIDNNWVMASGPQGSILLFFEISSVKNSTRLFYFYDDKSSEKSGDGTKDTGDGRSYGDMGIMVKAIGGGALKTDKLTVNYKAYFIDEPSLDASFGKQVIDWDQNPLTMTVREQYVTPAVVKQHRIQPGKFTLFPAYPNPFNPKTQKNVRFEFEASAAGSCELVLYNILGQQVASFMADSTTIDGRSVVLWDGRDAYGLPLHAGVYFLHLKSGMELETQKLVIQ